MKFSQEWTHSFLEQYGICRKRVTADCKGNRLSDDEIRAVMAEIQKVIVENKIPPKFTLNTDETGLFYGQGARNQWVQEGQTKGGIRGT
mmetsp:Transcript_40065/g.94170  ORF Transcript_40065/g.94170 Transcript_40065/m.94170 type:complete len:89 (+) Transcript_40065:272-538(+)|eukprot:3133101-Rhodomonas_salina.2